MTVEGIVDGLRLWIPTLLFAGVVSVVLHEALHWVVFKSFSRDVCLAREGWDPNVQINNPHAVPDWGIQLAGMAPFVSGTILTFIGVNWILMSQIVNSGNLFLVGLGVTTALPSLASGGDILATFAPSKFREFAENTQRETPSLSEAIKIITT